MRSLIFFRKFNCIQFLFKVFVNTIGTFDSKSTGKKGLISTREKIRTKSVHRLGVGGEYVQIRTLY